MNQNKFSSHVRKIFVFVVMIGLLFSALGAPNAVVVTAQEPTPTQEPASTEQPPTPEQEPTPTQEPASTEQPPTPEQEPTPTDDVSGQIVGGAPADPGEWPWQVALVDGISLDLYNTQFCGGSLIHPQWVVTAAHCVYGAAPSAVDVVAGIYNLSTPAAGYQRRDVSQIIIHPSYNPTTYDSDIALLRLASAVTIGGSGATKTALAPMVSSGIGNLAGTNSWVTGWGDTESTPAFPDQLYEVQVPIITNTICNQASSYNGAITANMLCAGFAAGGKDSCSGDSGGPLVVSVGGQWQLAGITSWGDGCADPNYYGVYTRISNFVNWIDDYVPAELAVNSIDVYPPDIFLNPNIYANDDVDIEIETQNIGSTSSGAFTVNIYVDGTPVTTACIINDPAREYHANSAGLASGAKDYWTITIPAGALSVGSHTVTVYIDSECAVTEVNESDNVLSATFTVNAVPVSAPSHDSLATPKVITNIPYTDPVDVRGATRHASDPTNISCPSYNLDAGLASVWYQYTPSSNTTLYLDTFGSNYDTYIAVWQGTMPGGTLVGCNDDYAVGNLQSALQVNLTGGNTYYFQVAQYSNDITNVNANSLGKSSAEVEAQAGGSLKFNVTSFADVPGNYWAWRWIEGFYSRGITTGCAGSPLQYCPDREVTRAEMAVFILRAKHGGAYQPPVQSGTFADVPVSGKEWMMKWIEQFYDEGLTTGCAVNPLGYCPERNVTRAEMAVFLLRAKYGASYQPPASNSPIFADVPAAGKEWMQAWIEEFYRQGYTTGCAASPLRYCPERNVTRAEMAVFISRAFGIPQLP